MALSPQQVVDSLGSISDGPAVLARILDEGGDPALIAALRAGFVGGDEQGNFRRLEALVALEGERALDVIEQVLIDEVEVGGPYSNLRNGALELIAARFLGLPRLWAPLARAMEIDEYLDGARLGQVLMPYDPEAGFQLLAEAVTWGSQIAIAALCVTPEGRAVILAALTAALTGGDHAASRASIAWLGALADDDEFAPIIIAHADQSPAAAVFAAARDPSRVAALVDRFDDSEPVWRSAAIEAFGWLDPGEVFDRAAPLFCDDKRGKGPAKAKLEAFAWEAGSLADPRWIPFLTERLAAETTEKLRPLLVKALGKTGPAAVPAILAAPRDDKDKAVLSEIPMAISRAGGGAETKALIEAAIAQTPKGKRRKTFELALGWI